MRSKILLLSGLLLLLGCSYKLKTYSAKEQRKDFSVFKSALLDATAKPYLYIDSLALDAEFNRVEDGIANGKTDVEWFQDLSGIVSKIGCGHTSLLPSSRLFGTYLTSKSFLPVQVKLVDRKLYVLSNHKNESKKKISKGAQITHINGRSIAQLLQSMYNLKSSDGFNLSMKDAFYRDLFGVYYFLSEGYQKSFSVKFINAEGEKDRIVMEPELPNLKAFNKMMDKNKFFNPSTMGKDKKKWGKKKINAKEDYAYLKIPTFKYHKGVKYEKWLDAFFKSVKKKEVNHLIIDLRGNLGGFPQNYLMGYLIDYNQKTGYIEVTNSNRFSNTAKYKQWDKEYWKWVLIKWRAKYVKKHKQRNLLIKEFSEEVVEENRFKGKVIVITDGMSFSSSAHLTANLKNKANAVSIGKTTGGGYQQGNTGGLNMKLPKSKYHLSLNPIYFNNNPDSVLTREIGIVPDVFVKEPLKFKKSNDPYFKAALKWIKDNSK